MSGYDLGMSWIRAENKTMEKWILPFYLLSGTVVKRLSSDLEDTPIKGYPQAAELTSSCRTRYTLPGSDTSYNTSGLECLFVLLNLNLSFAYL